MHVHLTIFGENADELYEQADSLLGQLASGRRWNKDFEVRPAMVLGDGVVPMWEAEVTASCEDPE